MARRETRDTNLVHYLEPQAGVQILAGLDSKWTLHDLFHEVEERKHFRKSMFYWGLGLVDLVRFELTTSSMPWKRAPNCATGPL